MAALAAPPKHSAAQPAAEDCPRCHGLGRVPLTDVRPWVWIEPSAPPKWEAIVAAQSCPVCLRGPAAPELAQELQQQFEAAQVSHRRWRQLTGWKLTLAVTRHATIHTQLSTAQTRTTAAALETLTLHLKRVTSSLKLTSTRPDTLELMLLPDKPSWDAFRAVLEGLYTPEQLGESWAPARDLTAYDLLSIPHFYETPQSIRARPPSCAATFIVARRQLNLAVGWKAPFWLAEGFAAYGDYVVHKLNRWYTTYAGESIPSGDWMGRARQLAADSTYCEWTRFFSRELRDWEPSDHHQSMAMVAFLLESEPAKFIDWLKRQSTGADPAEALQAALGVRKSELEERWVRWMLARR